METFYDWFEGEWNNRQQAYSNPRSAAFVHATHKRVSYNQFRCTYRYERQKMPYRDMLVTVEHRDGTIVVINPTMDIEFNLESGCYVAGAKKTIAGIEYICSAYLGPDHYFVVDRAINLETGAILWGLDEGDCFEFLRVEQESTSLPSS